MIFESQDLLIFTLFPLIGLLITYLLPQSMVKYIAIIAAIITIPIFTGYDYVIDWIYELNLTILLACGYYYLLYETKKHITRIVTTVLLSVTIFFPLAFNAFTHVFAGSQYIEKTWCKDDYKIQYVRDQGFSGRPAYYYQIIHCPVKGLFVKRLQDRGFLRGDCEILFEKQNIIIDKCE